MATDQSLPSRLKLFSLEVIAMVIVLLAAIVAFGFLSKGVMSDKPFSFDDQVFQKIKPYINRGNTKIMVNASLLASHYLLLPANLLLCAYFLFVRRNFFLIKIPVICLTGYLLNESLKRLFSHPRPLNPVFEAARGFSFPSGHSLSAMVFYGMIIYIVWNQVQGRLVRGMLIAVLSCLILLIGFSRVYLRVHYASDVIAGFSAGFIFLTTAIWVTNIIERKFRRSDNSSS